jgi:hypothetical protein
MEHTGNKKWIIPGGYIPFTSRGKEPAFLSQDKISILNINEKSATVRITIFYKEDEAVEYEPVKVKGRRIRKIRINDLINPFPVILETEYGIMIESDEPVVVQFSQMNTGQNSLSLMGTVAYGSD